MGWPPTSASEEAQMHYAVKIKSAQHAVQETREWLGDKRFDAFVGEARKLGGPAKQRLRQLYFYLGLAGVQGRGVVHAMFRYIWG